MATGGEAIGSKYVSIERLLDVTEVAQFLGLAPGTIYHLVSQRRIPVVRISARCVRFRPSDIMAWIERKSVKEE